MKTLFLMFGKIMCIIHGVDIQHQQANRGQMAEDIGKISKLRKLWCVCVCAHVLSIPLVHQMLTNSSAIKYERVAVVIRM